MDEKNLAFYYPGHLWQDGNAMKNLLLFFDGIALLVPEYKMHEPYAHDPVISEALADNGLLYPLSAEEFINKEAVSELAVHLESLLDSGKLDHLSRERRNLAHLSTSRLGFMADEDIADRILQELIRRGLAESSTDGRTLPMHTFVRALILTLLSQILRKTGQERGLDLSPATDHPWLSGSLREILSAHELPSAANVLLTDLATVGVDLSSVPIEDVLAFRSSQGSEYRAYARGLRDLMRVSSTLPSAEREEALADRQEEIEYERERLRVETVRAFGLTAGFSLAIAGAAWTVATGDPLGALISVLSATATGATALGPQRAEAYSYLFAARRMA